MYSAGKRFICECIWQDFKASYVLNGIAEKAARDPNAGFSLAEWANSTAGGALSGVFYGGVGTALDRALSNSGTQAQTTELAGTLSETPLQARERKAVDTSRGLLESEVSRRMSAEDREFHDVLLKAVGLRGEIVSQESDIVNAQIKDGVVTIFANAEDAERGYRSTVKHEVTHQIKALGAAHYQAFETFAVEQAAARNGVSIDSLVESVQEVYRQQAGQELTAAQAREEIAGDFAMLLDVDTETVRRFTQQTPQNRQTAHGILQTIRDIVDRVREYFKGRKLTREQSAFLDRLSEGERLWAEALGEASQLARNEKAVQTDGSEARYAVKRAADGSLYVEVEEDILGGLGLDPENISPEDRKTLHKLLSSVVSSQFNNPVDVNGQETGIKKKTAKEWVRSGSATALLREDGGKYLDKIRAFANADELLQAVQDYKDERPKHPRKDDFVKFRRGDVQLRIGGTDYNAEVVVGITDKGYHDLYDIVKMIPTKIEEAPETIYAAQGAANRRHEASSDISIADGDGDVKRKFSLKNADKAVKQLAKYREQYDDQLRRAGYEQIAEQLRRSAQVQQQLYHAAVHHARRRLELELETVRKQYPDFDLQAELDGDPRFKSLLLGDFDLLTAYQACHGQELFEAARRQMEEQVRARIRENLARPVENGLQGGLPVRIGNDPSKWNRKQFREIEKRVQRGEKIYL